MLGLPDYNFIGTFLILSCRSVLCGYPSIVDLLNIICKCTFIALDSSFSTCGWNPSGLDDLEIFNLFSFFSTISGVIITSLSATLSCRSCIIGMVSVSSLVNTLMNYLFRISAVFHWHPR